MEPQGTNDPFLDQNLEDYIRFAADHGFIDINTTSLYDTVGSYNLRVCLAESNIINWQKDGQIEVEDYEHNHVLRTVIMDESLAANQSFVAGEIFDKSININCDERYNGYKKIHSF